MLGWRIIDGFGARVAAAVEKTHALRVTTVSPDTPPEGTPNRERFFNVLLGTEGADGGTTNENVDGAATPVEFYVSAHADYDIHITQIVVLIADTSVVHNAFGNVAALANGWDLVVEESGASTDVIRSASTGGEVIAQGMLGTAYGDAATSFELANWTGGGAASDATLVSMRVADHVPGGIRLGRGTADRIVSTVNDDLTGLVQFDVRVLGHRRYPA